MTPQDLGFLTIAIAASALLFALGALSSRFFHDCIYQNLTPGLVPAKGQAAPERRVQPGQEYSGEVAVAFAPPKGLGPGLVGTIVDGKAELRDITATIVDLARRGHVGIAAVDDGAARQADPTRKSRDWEVVREARPPADELSAFEVQVLTSLFGKRSPGTPVRVSAWVRKNRATVRSLRDQLYRQSVANGWYRRVPDSGRGRGLRALGFVVLFAWCATMLLSGFTLVKLAAAAILIGSAIFASRRLRPREPRTAKGTAVCIQALGFKKYLATAEADQFSFEEAAGIFSRYLPYAIVFGVAAHWAKVFGQVLEARGEQLGETALVAMDVLTEVDWFTSMGPGLDASDVGFVDLGDLLDAGDGIVELVAGIAEGVGEFIGGLN